MPTGLGLPQSKIVHLLGKGSQLSHPLLGGNELGGHIPMQPHLFDEVALVLLLLVKEPGFLPAVSDKGLKKDDGQNTKIQEERRGREARSSEYPASGNDDFMQGTPSMVQGFQHNRNPLIESLPLHALSGIVEGEECRRWVLWIHPLE